ncbi:MAG: hypothetical protein GF308_07350 [Candidatus Heimdallarchaeota archaeon]|nr:hypothetical protein [Candidatus Heimdallarchaeota archaeon]
MDKRTEGCHQWRGFIERDRKKGKKGRQRIKIVFSREIIDEKEKRRRVTEEEKKE